jgi:hypothetical protein
VKTNYRERAVAFDENLIERRICRNAWRTRRASEKHAQYFVSSAGENGNRQQQYYGCAKEDFFHCRFLLETGSIVFGTFWGLKF